MTVWVAYIRHRHGTDLYAASSEAELRRKIADYCRLWWMDTDDAYGEESEPPVDNDECIAKYFDAVDDEGCGIESIEI